MPHETTLITTIVAGLVLAFIFGAIANRFRLPPLVGYLFAGILAGPNTPGFIADTSLAQQLSEIGVILLMFGVGLHFSLKDLMSVRALAIPGAAVQIAFATALGLGLALLLGWGLGGGLVFGLALSVASTVVLLKAMQDRRLIDTDRGRLAVGWLIVEDLAMVLALVLIPAFASLGGEGAVVLHDPFVSFVERLVGSEIGLAGIIGVTLVKIAAFVGFMLVVGRRVIPWMLHAVAHTGNRELFRLAVLAIALGVALGSAYLFGVSLALGAFFAGMILSESELSQRAAQETLPLRDAFAVLFFVSVGMLFDPGILLREPLPVLATLLIIVVGKAIIAYGVVRLFRHPISTAVVIAASLSQIGEFSFILADLGVGLNIMPEAGRSYILAGAILSIILNPLMFFLFERLRPRFEAKAGQRRPAAEPAEAGQRLEPSVDAGPAEADLPPEPAEDQQIHDIADADVEPSRLTGHAILVGYGRVGYVAAESLLARGEPFLLIEDADGRVAMARDKGIEVVVGNAANPDVLRLANVAAASALLVAIPNAFEAGQVTEQGRKLNKTMRIIVRSHSLDEDDYFERLGADVAIMGEREIGLGMVAQLDNVGEPPAETDPSAAPAEPRIFPAPLPADPQVVAPPAAVPEGLAAEAPEPESVEPARLPANPNLLQDMAEAEQLSPAEPVDPPMAPAAPEEDIVTELAIATALPEANIADPATAPHPDEMPGDADRPVAQAGGEPMRFEPLVAADPAPASPPAEPPAPIPETPPAEPRPAPLPPEPQPTPPAPEPEPEPEPIQVPPEPVPPAPEPPPSEVPPPPAEVPPAEPPMIEPTPVEAPVQDPVEVPDSDPGAEVPITDPSPATMPPTRMDGDDAMLSDPAGEPSSDPEQDRDKF